MVAKSTLWPASYDAPGTSGRRVSMIEIASIYWIKPRLGTRSRDFLLQLHEAINERFRTRRAARYIHVHRNHLIDTLDDGVVIEDAADRRTRAHRDDPLRVGHLVVDAPHGGRHLSRQPAGDDHQVRLARRAAEHLGAESRDIVPTGRHRHHLDRTAREAELCRPDGRTARP